MFLIFTLSLEQNTLEAIQYMFIESYKVLGNSIQIKHLISKSLCFKLFILVMI